MSERILIAVDDSAASRQAVDYAARMAAGREDTWFHLVNVRSPSNAPGKGSADHQEEARALLEGLRQRLISDGADASRVDVGTLVGHPDRSMIDGLLDVARDQQAGTVVVGRNALPWHKELFHHHVADELVKQARGFALWIVE